MGYFNGIHLSRTQLYKIKTVKAFNHDYPQSVLYDPSTGKKLWKEQERPIPAYDEYCGILAGIEVIAAGYGEDDLFAGLVVGHETSSNGGSVWGYLELDGLDTFKQKLKEALEPLGLWDSTKFGLYAVLQFA